MNQPAPAGGPWIGPYDYLAYLAAGSPSPAEVMKATGIRRFTLAFIVSGGGCQPVWDSGDPQTGGPEEAVIRGIRAAGGDVSMAFGGMGGTKLALTCTSPKAWTIMPFDFAGPGTDMGHASVQAAEGLKNDLMNAYHEPASAAYRTMGISSMNGRTDAGELVSVADFQLMLRYVQAHPPARFAFWSVNRDLPCTPGSDSNTCSGIAQTPYAFTRTSASYSG